jgi:hypothetical protein
MAGISYIQIEEGELRIYAGELSELASMANVDVELVDAQQTRWGATFFSLDGAEALFQKNAITGECARGTYLWASDMILVRILSLETIRETIRELRHLGEFDGAFSRLPDS